MSYKEKPQIKLYKYIDSAFVLQAIIDDFQECSFEHNQFSAGQFSITINYNIPNALLFERGLFVQFSNNPYNFGEILNITDSIGEDGKGSQFRIITGYDARYIFKRRIIRNLNNNDTWVMTAKGELCMRNLILDQCGNNAESKRRLPVVNTIPSSANAIGKEYSVSEAFSNLYEVLTTIATQSEVGWRLNFNGETLTLEFYSGEDRHLKVRFDTDYESLSNGEFVDSSASFANAVFVGGKGSGSDRDIYEGESAIEGDSPSGLDRFEAWDNQSSMTTENEYVAEALSMLNQYGQTLQVSGKGLAKCPYEYGEQYNVGDLITIAFSGKSAIVQILSVTEHWAWGAYDLEFSFGKPQPDLSKQLQLILKQIQKASNKTSSTDSVRWYTIPTDTAMPSGDVTYNTIGFIGNCASGGSTFKLYLDNEKTGAKTYHVYFKQLGGGKLTLTTGKEGASNLVLNSGTYVAIIYVDENGNITSQGATATSLIESGSTQPVTSGAVNTALGGKVNTSDIVDTITSGNMHPVTSNAVANLNSLEIPYNYSTESRNVFALIENAINNRFTVIRIGGENISNAPDGSTANDFYYVILKIGNPYIKVIAYDIRSENVYVITRINNIWGTWKPFAQVRGGNIADAVSSVNTTYIDSYNFFYNQVGKLHQFSGNIVIKADVPSETILIYLTKTFYFTWFALTDLANVTLGKYAYTADTNVRSGYSVIPSGNYVFNFCAMEV